MQRSHYQQSSSGIHSFLCRTSSGMHVGLRRREHRPPPGVFHHVFCWKASQTSGIKFLGHKDTTIRFIMTSWQRIATLGVNICLCVYCLQVCCCVPSPLQSMVNVFPGRLVYGRSIASSARNRGHSRWLSGICPPEENYLSGSTRLSMPPVR